MIDGNAVHFFLDNLMMEIGKALTTDGKVAVKFKKADFVIIVLKDDLKNQANLL